jgi:hypothetical protein
MAFLMLKTAANAACNIRQTAEEAIDADHMPFAKGVKGTIRSDRF